MKIKQIVSSSVVFICLSSMASPVFAASLTANAANCNVTTFNNIILPIQTQTPLPPLNPPQLIIESATPISSPTLGQYCDVIGHIHTENLHHVTPAEIAAAQEKEIQIEVKLPTIWNTKYLQYGGGGFDGSIAAATSVGFVWTSTATNSPLSATYSTDGGYAISATDSGHVGGSAAFINTNGTQNVQRWLNYSYQSRHLLAETSKLMINQYYGTGPTYSYHSGVSKGGLSGIVEAARYPYDFDGIVALAPVVEDGSKVISGFIRIIQTQFPTNCTPSTLSTCLASQILPTAGANNVLPLIAAATMSKCDAQDGLVDGVISDPARCDFDPINDLPTCANVAGPSCLTSAQKNVLKTLYSDDPYSGFPRYLPGYESDPNRLMAALALGGTPTTARSSMYTLGEDATRYWLYNNPSITLQSVNLATQINDLLDWQACGPGPCSAFDPHAFFDFNNDTDLSIFKSIGGTHGTGGKLLIFHGLADALVPTAVSVNYYNKLSEMMGGLNNTRDFARLFLIIGRSHGAAATTGAAGTPANVEMSLGANTGFQHALENWVEKSVAPDQVIGQDADPATITRPICAYPNRAVYTGPVGDSAKMKNANYFECRFYDFKNFAPPVEDRPVVNKVKAGQAIPVKFSLGGNWGLNILAAGFPKSEVTACDATAPANGIDETVNANDTVLEYDATSDQYKYVWKTNKSWSGTCRQLVMRLNEGTTLRANFEFQ